MTLLPLDTFRQIVGWNPFHFWGLGGPSAPVSSKCNDVIAEYAWQNSDMAGRYEVRQAIGTAEDRLREYLGYAVAPRWASATLPYRMPLQLPEGHVHTLGVPRIQELGTVPVTSFDRDGDELLDWWEVSLPVADDVRVDELVVRFADADSGARRVIRPVRVQIANGVATIGGATWLLVRPDLRAGLRRDPLDAADPGVYVSEVVVERHTVDTTRAAAASWEGSCCSSAASLEHDRLMVLDGERGIIGLNPCRCTWTCCSPARVNVSYLAGYPLDGGHMARHWQTIVARLAMAELARPIAACGEANKELHEWQFDLARSAGVNDEQYQISLADLDSPFGTRRGQVYAWRQVRNLRQARSITI